MKPTVEAILLIIGAMLIVAIALMVMVGERCSQEK